MGSRIHVYPNGSLAIEAVTEKDAGDYLCVARNRIGEDLILMKVSITMKPVTAVRHSKKHIDCRAEGTPPPQIMWIMPDNIFLTAPYYGSRIVVHKNGTLEIRNIRPSDMGDFICVARNDGGETVLVVPPPAIHTTPGAAVQLHCVVLGVPKPEITWELPDRSVLSTAHQARGSGGALLHPTGTLLLQNPQPSSSGTYRCTARNALARNTAGVVGTQAAASLGSALQRLPSKLFLFTHKVQHLSRDRATTESRKRNQPNGERNRTGSPICRLCAAGARAV
uniref:Ig-like domain-containing protein n=1 Tax=Zonotrichia albicollis TaxID=44394 RepID=A0A8D2MTQ9_ZONAL